MDNSRQDTDIKKRLVAELRNMSAVVLLLAVVMTSWSFILSPVLAQGALPITRSYVTPFPDRDRYQLYVLGDSLADGIWSGLVKAFPKRGFTDVVRQSKVGTGLVRVRRFNWNIVLDKILNVHKVQIAVVMMGANDDKGIRLKRKSYKFMSPKWKDIYGQRIDQFMKRLKRSKVAVYWVGLPIMGKPSFNKNMQSINDLIREKAFVNGIKFIDTWAGFTDQFGRYSVYGPDLTGRVRRLRANDGVHFTPHGYRKLAHFVEREIRKDLKAAKRERDIPLAGDQEEQDRAIGKTTVAAVTRSVIPGRKAKSAPKGKAKLSRNGSEKDLITSLLKNKKKGKGRKLRSAPVQPVNVKNPLHGETIANEMSIGLTALASVSSLNDATTKEGHRRLPLAERPYHKVLVKGFNLPAKINRADEFSWPPG